MLFEIPFVVVISAALLLKGHKYTIFKGVRSTVYESSTGFRAVFGSEMQIPSVEPEAHVERKMTNTHFEKAFFSHFSEIRKQLV